MYLLLVNVKNVGIGGAKIAPVLLALLQNLIVDEDAVGLHVGTQLERLRAVAARELRLLTAGKGKE